MLFTERIRLIQDLEIITVSEIPITVASEMVIPVVSETLTQVEDSETGIQEVSDNREIPEVLETVIQEVSEILSLTEVSVIPFLSQDQIISSHHSQDITTEVSDLMIPEASDPVEVLTPVAEASEEVPAAVAVSDPVAEAEVASGNLSN